MSLSMCPFWRPVVVCAALLLGPRTQAQTSYPMVTRVYPAAVQRGRTADVTIAAVQDLSGASGLLFEGSGLTAEVSDAGSAPPPATKRRRSAATGSVKARMTVASDARL